MSFSDNYKVITFYFKHTSADVVENAWLFFLIPHAYLRHAILSQVFQAENVPDVCAKLHGVNDRATAVTP
jgi:hypothetical protein